MLVAWNRTDPAELLQLTEICLLGLHHTERTDPRVAGFTVAGVNSGLTSWHSRDTLRGEPEECKSNEDDRKST